MKIKSGSLNEPKTNNGSWILPKEFIKKKVVIGMFVLIACAGMAMAHINKTICSTNGCSTVISKQKVNVKDANGKSCKQCSTDGVINRSGKCPDHEAFCKITDTNAKNGDERAKSTWYDYCKD